MSDIDNTRYHANPIGCCGTHRLKELEEKWKTNNPSKYEEFKRLEDSLISRADEIKLNLREEEENGCKGMVDKRDGWISTYSGKKFYIFNPKPEEIDINDIARALSMICRFGGHVKRFYSVAQHSVMVSRICPTEFAMEGLMHDATEAFVGDLIRPIKRFMPDFKDVENTLERAIADRFHLSLSCHEEIKKADNIALVTEARDLLTTQVIMDSFDSTIQPLSKRIKPVKPNMAEQKFLERFYELNGVRNGSGTKRSFSL